MSRSPRRTALHLGALSLLLFTTACSKPEPPDKEQPPEPKAAQVETHTELRDAIQAPIDRAKAVSPQVIEAARQQRDDIDAQTSGGDAPAPPQ